MAQKRGIEEITKSSLEDIKKANKDFVKTGENQNFVEGIFKFRF